MVPIDPTAALGLSEWQIPGIGGISPAETVMPQTGTPAVDGVAATGAGGFGQLLATEVGKLSDLQTTAATAAQSLADGTATDPSTVVMAVEKAQLAMQLAGQLRTKGVEALNDVFHTQV